MAKKNDENDREPGQQTPKGHTIPVPTRGQVFRNLEKVAKAPRRSAKGKAAPDDPRPPAEPS